MAHRSAVILAPYSEQWPLQFQEECAKLVAAFPAESFSIEHVGSTAVPGLPAKPIIDMMLGARTLREIELRVPAIERLGYEYMPQHEQVMPERRFFAKPLIRPRHFHLHAVVQESAFWNEHLAFRNALRANPGLALKYADLKLRLASQFGDDREGYTDAKGPFISEVLQGVSPTRG